MGHPIPPPSKWLFYEPIRYVHRILWRLILGIINFLFLWVFRGNLMNFVLWVVFGSRLSETISAGNGLGNMNVIWEFLLHLALVVTTILSGRSSSQAAAQQAASPGPRDSHFRIPSGLQQVLDNYSAAVIGASPLYRAIQRFGERYRVAATRREMFWHEFWDWYFVFGGDDHFQQNVLEACRRHLSHELATGEQLRAFEVCIDNGVRIEVPCPPTLDDKSFFAHLLYFYNFAKAHSTSFSGLSLRSLGRVEISQVRFPALSSSWHCGPQLTATDIRKQHRRQLHLGDEPRPCLRES